MNECFRCGISGENARLFDAIADEGIVKICSRCLGEENLPLIQKATTSQIKESEKEYTFQDRVKEFNKPYSRDNTKQDVSLRDIVDRNFQIKSSEQIKPRPDLIDNFHWVIMRKRRAKHISRQQFAKDLGESETLIKMVEQGKLPEDDNRIIKKIEGYLRVNLRRPEFRISEEQKPKELEFNPVSIHNLTISDLQEMKNKRDAEFGNESSLKAETPSKFSALRSVFRKKRDKVGKEPVENQEKELSQQEIDDLIFGKGE